MGNARVGIGEGAPQTTLHVFGSLGLRVEEPNYNFMTIACNPGRCALNTSGTGVAGAGNYIEIDPDSLTYGLILRDHLGTVIATSNAKWSNLMTVDGANYGSTTDFMQMGVETTTDGIFITNTSLVGIGAVRPTQKLEVVGNINTSYTLAATTNGVCHSGANAAAALPVGDRRVLVVCSGAPTDIAEWYDTTGTEPGDVVATTDKTITYDSPVVNARTGEILNTSDSLTVSVLERSGRAYQPNLLGVISTSPAQSYGRSIINVSQMPNPLAIAGRVPVKISTANGPIRPGDAITSSMLEGFGMKATEPGTIVGRALDSFDGSSGELCKNDPRYKCGKIVIYISVGYWEPEKHEQNQESEMKQLKQALEKLRVENLELNAKYKRLEALFEK
jgi:hypothetical protein